MGACASAKEPRPDGAEKAEQVAKPDKLNLEWQDTRAGTQQASNDVPKKEPLPQSDIDMIPDVLPADSIQPRQRLK